VSEAIALIGRQLDQAREASSRTLDRSLQDAAAGLN